MLPVGTLPGDGGLRSGVNDLSAWPKDVAPFVLPDTDLFRARSRMRST